jgi:hypothetical protein
MLKKAQSFLDYALLIAIVSVSLAAMSGYVIRSINARVFHIKADLNDPINGVR